MINRPSDGRHLVYILYIISVYRSRGLEINSQCRKRSKGNVKLQCNTPSPFHLVRTIERLRLVGMKNEELLILNDTKKIFQTQKGKSHR